MNCVTNISQIEKIYCNTHNHDVKAPVVYADDNQHLYADSEFTKPVDYKLLKDLFFEGVVICGGGYYLRAIVLYSTNIDDVRLVAIEHGENANFFGYDVENDTWHNAMPE